MTDIGCILYVLLYVCIIWLGFIVHPILGVIAILLILLSLFGDIL